MMPDIAFALAVGGGTIVGFAIGVGAAMLHTEWWRLNDNHAATTRAEFDARVIATMEEISNEQCKLLAEAHELLNSVTVLKHGRGDIVNWGKQRDCWNSASYVHRATKRHPRREAALHVVNTTEQEPVQ